MFLSLATVLLATNLVAATANQIPNYNLDPTCRAAAVADISGRTVDACKRDEQQARDQLSGQWTTFLANDKARCHALTTLGGNPSYVELLTCLEMARDVRKLHNSPDTTGTVGRSR